MVVVSIRRYLYWVCQYVDIGCGSWDRWSCTPPWIPRYDTIGWDSPSRLYSAPDKTPPSTDPCPCSILQRPWLVPCSVCVWLGPSWFSGLVRPFPHSWGSDHWDHLKCISYQSLHQSTVSRMYSNTLPLPCGFRGFTDTPWLLVPLMLASILQRRGTGSTNGYPATLNSQSLFVSRGYRKPNTSSSKWLKTVIKQTQLIWSKSQQLVKKSKFFKNKQHHDNLLPF